MRVILASGSPRRKELLGNMGFSGFEVLKPEFDEDAVTAPDPGMLVETLSAGKAEAAAREANDPEALLLAADTVVVLDETVLGKPKDEAEAFAMLSALSGRSHRVYTGVTLRRGGEVLTEHEVSEVTFRTLTEEEIRNYIATKEPMDKAGSYGIQGFGALLVEGIRGDYFNVMGLPVCRLGNMLKRFDVDCLRRAAK
jgi:septum formation protein